MNTQEVQWKAVRKFLTDNNLGTTPTSMQKTVWKKLKEQLDLSQEDLKDIPWDQIEQNLQEKFNKSETVKQSQVPQQMQRSQTEESKTSSQQDITHEVGSGGIKIVKTKTQLPKIEKSAEDKKARTTMEKRGRPAKETRQSFHGFGSIEEIMSEINEESSKALVKFETGIPGFETEKSEPLNQLIEQDVFKTNEINQKMQKMQNERFRLMFNLDMMQKILDGQALNNKIIDEILIKQLEEIAQQEKNKLLSIESKIENLQELQDEFRNLETESESLKSEQTSEKGQEKEDLLQKLMNMILQQDKDKKAEKILQDEEKQTEIKKEKEAEEIVQKAGIDKPIELQQRIAPQIFNRLNQVQKMVVSKKNNPLQKIDVKTGLQYTELF